MLKYYKTISTIRIKSSKQADFCTSSPVRVWGSFGRRPELGFRNVTQDLIHPRGYHPCPLSSQVPVAIKLYKLDHGGAALTTPRRLTEGPRPPSSMSWSSPFLVRPWRSRWHSGSLVPSASPPALAENHHGHLFLIAFECGVYATIAVTIAAKTDD